MKRCKMYSFYFKICKRYLSYPEVHLLFVVGCSIEDLMLLEMLWYAVQLLVELIASSVHLELEI